MTIYQATLASVKPPQPPRLPGNYIDILSQSVAEFEEGCNGTHLSQSINYYYRGHMAMANAVMGFAAANNLSIELPIGAWPRDKRYCQELIEILTQQKIFPAAIMVQIQQHVNSLQDLESNAADIGVNYFYQLPENPLSLFRTVGGVQRYAAEWVTFHDIMGNPVQDVHGHHGYRCDSLGSIVNKISKQSGFNLRHVTDKMTGISSR